MKVLIVAPYIFIEGHKHGSRNRSGLAYMIRDIADMLSEQGAEVFVLTQSVFTNQIKVGKFVMLPKKFVHLLKGFKKIYFKYALKAINFDKIPFSKKLRILMYFLIGGYMESVIKKLKPDVVQIHSISFYTLPFILACVRTKTKFIVTLHGLTSFSDVTNCSEIEKKLEREFLDLSRKFEIITTVVSTGIKNRIKNWQKCNVEYIYVVLNSVKPNISKQYNSKQDYGNKLILCIGSLTERKNQLQVVRAFELLQNRRREGYKLLLVGNGVKRDEIENYIKENNILEVKCIGSIPRKEVLKLYDEASLVVMASIDEGFGLPVVESYSKGVPVVAFADLDAITDIYSEDAMILVNERSDLALSEAIAEALNRKWDKYKIIDFYSKFNPSTIGKQYYNILSSCLENNVSVKDLETMLKKLFE